MKEKIHLSVKSTVSGTVEQLPASKSISNRALIIDALAGGGSNLKNLSAANDTRLMRALVNSPDPVIDVEDAGTTMRFLTAYFAVTGAHKTLTGTPRMQERPLGILVDALRSLGATIRYKNREGFPPISTMGFGNQLAREVSIRGDVSSQFISAIMMIAPVLPQGLTIRLTGKVASRPYIEMTASLMRTFGAECHVGETSIEIGSTPYHPAEMAVESDWSAASYWFAVTALAEQAELKLPFLFDNSLQGDHVVGAIMRPLGVDSEMKEGYLALSKITPENHVTWDFTHCPDLAQTVAVVCAAKGIAGTFTGLESLRIKETDRIAALQNELAKIGAMLNADADVWRLVPSEKLPASATFETYDDHRMAMAFAPLATRMEVVVNHPGVVRKSYPGFWDDFSALGFEITRLRAED